MDTLDEKVKAILYDLYSPNRKLWMDEIREIVIKHLKSPWSMGGCGVDTGLRKATKEAVTDTPTPEPSLRIKQIKERLHEGIQDSNDIMEQCNKCIMAEQVRIKKCQEHIRTSEEALDRLKDVE